MESHLVPNGSTQSLVLSSLGSQMTTVPNGSWSTSSVPLDLKDHLAEEQEIKVSKASKVLRVSKESQVQLEFKASKASKVSKEIKAFKESQVQLEFKDSKVSKASKEIKAFKESLVQLEFKASKASKASKVSKESLVLLVQENTS